MTNFLENEKYGPEPKLHDDQGREKHFWYRYGDRYETKATTLENLAN